MPALDMKSWNKARIVDLLTRNDDAVGRALVALLHRQTQGEQTTHMTVESNGIGFNAYDADFMTSLAKQYRDKGYLTTKQLAALRKPKGLFKYAGQLADIANAKVEAKLAKMEADQ